MRELRLTADSSVTNTLLEVTGVEVMVVDGVDVGVVVGDVCPIFCVKYLAIPTGTYDRTATRSPIQLHVYTH